MTNKAKNKIKNMNFLTQPRTRERTIDLNKTKENYRKDNEKLPTITRGSVRPQHI